MRDQIAKSSEAIGETIAAGKDQDDTSQAVAAYSKRAAQMTPIELRAFARIFQDLDEQQRGHGQTLAMMNGIFREKHWNEN